MRTFFPIESIAGSDPVSSQGHLLNPTAVDRKSPLRILDITKFYGEASGGVRTYLDAKIRDFEKRAVHHALVIPGERAEVSTLGNTKVYRVPGPVIPFAPNYRLMTSLPAIERIIEEERPDIIEIGSPFLVPILVRKAIGKRPIRTVGFYHSDLIRTYAEPYVRRDFLAPIRIAARTLARAYIPWVYRPFDVTVATSETVVEELRKLGVTQVHTIPLGVDREVFSPHGPVHLLHERLGIDRSVPIALYVGRFCPEKRLDVVLDAHSEIPESRRPHLVFVGDGPLRTAFEEVSKNRSGLSLLPYEHDRREVAALLRGADFYLAPGPGETFGLAIAEAIACGLPVVAVEKGAAPDRLAGIPCGLLYRHGDRDSCAATLLDMVAHLSPALARSSCEYAEREAMGWTTTFDRLLDLYTSLLHPKR